MDVIIIRIGYNFICQWQVENSIFFMLNAIEFDFLWEMQLNAIFC